MSYRHRIYRVPKSFVEEAQQLTSLEEFIPFYKKYCHKDVHTDVLDEGETLPLYYIGKELFDYGDRSEVGEKMYNYGSPLFSNETLTNMYDHYKPVVLSEEGLLFSIEFLKNQVADIYEDLLREESSNKWKKGISQFDRMKHHIESVYQTWRPEFGNYTVYNLNKGTDELVMSWLWEHQIWDLVRIYKTFDWDNYSMIFYGW